MGLIFSARTFGSVLASCKENGFFRKLPFAKTLGDFKEENEKGFYVKDLQRY